MEKVLCKECNKYFNKAGFKHHLIFKHKINFYDYLVEHNIDVYLDGQEIDSYKCLKCDKSLDKFITFEDGVFILKKVGCGCLANKKHKKIQYECVFFDRELSNEYKNMFKGRFTLDWFIKRYGEEEGRNKYLEKNEKCVQNLENFIKRYGEEEGKIKWEEYRELKRATSPRTLGYWIDKGYSKEDAVLLKKEFNSRGTNLKYLQKKYGEEGGLFRYKRALKLRLQTIKAPGSISKDSYLCFNFLVKYFNLDKKHCFFGKNEMVVENLYENDSRSFYKLDFYYKPKKLWIEYNGIFWHGKNYLDDDILNFPGGDVSVKEIRERDRLKIENVIKMLNISPPIIIWEDDWKLKNEEILNIISKRIKE